VWVEGDSGEPRPFGALSRQRGETKPGTRGGGELREEGADRGLDRFVNGEKSFG